MTEISKLKVFVINDYRDIGFSELNLSGRYSIRDKNQTIIYVMTPLLVDLKLQSDTSWDKISHLFNFYCLEHMSTLTIFKFHNNEYSFLFPFDALM